jgi:hypothetical protein
MEQKVRDAFNKFYNENKLKKKEDKETSGQPCCISSGYGLEVAPDYVIFEKDGKKFKLFYDGGPENPQFDPLSEAEEVESKQEYVPVKESKKESDMEDMEPEAPMMDEDEMRVNANEILKKMGQPALLEDEDIPGWLMKKINGGKTKSSAKGAYAE